MSEKKASAAHEETTSSDEPRKKESLTDQITETFSELTESISQVRSNRRRALCLLRIPFRWFPPLLRMRLPSRRWSATARPP